MFDLDQLQDREQKIAFAWMEIENRKNPMKNELHYPWVFFVLLLLLLAFLLGFSSNIYIP